MKLFIKNMVCDRCKTAVKTTLQAHHLHPTAVTLGEVDITEPTLTPEQVKEIADALHTAGFELIDDRISRITEKIKNVVVMLVHYTGEQPRQKYSELIANELHLDYPYLSKIFSEAEGLTIEQYIINQKTERIKEYLTYNELSLTAIADHMGYSSTAHLSAQFKKATGLTPTQFKKTGSAYRKPLDEVGS